MNFQDSEDGRCEWCNTPLFDHEQQFGKCQSCRIKEQRLQA